MVSRRKFLLRSRDDLHADSTFQPPEDEEDVWYQKDKLYKDHIQEVLNKWTQIDDEIWAKVIVLERNRRVAKAYARAPVLTVNGSNDDFDGFRIGLCGFENPMRDQKTKEYKSRIGHGVKIKIDEENNVLIKRVSKCNVYIKSTGQDQENAIGNEILKVPSCALESEKPVKLFDMKKFQSNVNRELRNAYPDRRRLECQCLSAIAFVKSEKELLECPIWVLIINVVAMGILKSKLPPVQKLMHIRPRSHLPMSDEDPYSVAGHGSSSGYSGSGSSAIAREQQKHAQRRSEKPPKLPPRENMYFHELPKRDHNQQEYESRPNPIASKSKDKSKDMKKYDDPYYCGLRARVPNFVSKSKPRNAGPSKKFSFIQQNPHVSMMHQHHLHQQEMPNTRSYESGKDFRAIESPYSQIYGRLPIPTRAYMPNPPPTMYIGEWD